ncbi:SulP family inorganic anion transporter [Echinicola vietnamensis]|uniref:Sulfate permease-like transporter, MFS superfamily n=1 Tax=Echinicola vietnamensis (strain DSM 17526 / LMG 23754 / KMM 6221) TaxID=926556 RepID=L0FZB3_ECHVK|nr:SulP family inorganic anion transporter [Echinicola vietnamensis]AGA79269.1 sulfate permease-like transporter, MFS superfamily [Echinicola vietnamensis DSM 17526]
MTQMFFNLFRPKQSSLKDEVLSGFTVALALVPEAVAFSFIAQVSPLVGLYSAFFIGLITAILGGRPGMISGATGAIAVVVVALVVTHGVEYLFAAVVLMGIIQVLVGVLKLGKLIRLVPHPVMYGFVNGLAVIIFTSQFEQFKIETSPGVKEWISGPPLWIMLALVVLTMVIIKFLPKVTKIIPSALAAILVISGIVIFGNIDTRTVGDMASISGGLPEFHLPMVPLNWETFMIILPYSAIMAGVGLIESLLTLTLVDEITETRGNGNKECIAQGVANVTTGFFGGMGGCAMIGQSLINVNAGGRNRISGIIAACGLLTFILFFSSYIEMIPMAALVGLMFMVAIGTFEWASLKIFKKVPASDVLVMIVVMLVTVFLHNLALAVLVGVIIAALVFAWENSKMIRARKRVDENGVKHYEIYGPLFFASAQAFGEKFDPVNDPDEIIIDFAESRIVDHSGIDAVHKVTERYDKAGKTVYIRHLSTSSKTLLEKAEKIINVNYADNDPSYKIVMD